MERIRSLLYIEPRPFGLARGFFAALELARSHGSRLTVAAVAGPPGWYRTSGPPDGAAHELPDPGVRGWKRRLRELAGRGELRGVQVETRLLEGDASEAVVREVVRHGHDLVMKVAGGGSPLRPWPLDPTDQRLLRHCPSALWILHPAQGARIRVVMAGVDVTPGRSAELEERVVRTAAALADRTGAELHVVHAWCMPGESILASPLRGVSSRRLAGLLRDTARDRRSRLDRLLARAAPGRRPTVTLRKGPVVSRLRREARWAGADVVVVGHSRRSGLGSVIPGNVAEKLVGRVDGSVLSIGASTGGAEPLVERGRGERRVGGRAGSPA